MTMKKRNLIVSSLAVTLAATLLLGGATITYLSDQSGYVTNTFNTNEIDIDLNETTDNSYEIIPGMSDKKDPTITGTFTVDSYLYVLVYECNPTITYTNAEGETVTETVIDYKIADDWTKLPYDYDKNGDGTNDSYSAEVLANFTYDTSKYTQGYDEDAGTETNGITIYYREVSASDTEQSFEVLKNNLVSYSSEIIDMSYWEDMDLFLAFSGYAIQQQPFASALDALTLTVVDDDADLLSAIKAGETVTLSSDISVDASALNEAIATAVSENNATGATIDLNGQTLTVTGSSAIDLVDQTLSLTDGTVKYKGSNTVAIAIESGSSLTLDCVTLNVDSTASGATSAINIEGCTETATLTIKNSTINSEEYFALSTNATTPASSNVTVVIENSTLSTSECNDDPETTGILFNVPGTLTITNSTITGGSQGVIVRGGTANITNSIIKATITGDGADVSSFSTTIGYLDGSADWKSGNQLPAAALVAGNHSASAYAYDTSVTLDNVTLTVGGETDTVPAIYAAQSNSSYSTTLTGVSDSDTILYYVGSGCSVSVNNNSLSGTEATLTTIGKLGATE